jgi:hypothetical protein
VEFDCRLEFIFRRFGKEKLGKRCGVRGIVHRSFSHMFRVVSSSYCNGQDVRSFQKSA